MMGDPERLNKMATKLLVPLRINSQACAKVPQWRSADYVF
jgi:hypothetical protein